MVQLQFFFQNSTPQTHYIVHQLVALQYTICTRTHCFLCVGSIQVSYNKAWAQTGEHEELQAALQTTGVSWKRLFYQSCAKVLDILVIAVNENSSVATGHTV